MTDGQGLGLVRTADPASGEPDPVKWLGHRDLCPVQWGKDCDCVVQIDGMVCGRCNQQTGNRSQGHYWKYYKVTRSMREFHFCCPGNCELEGEQ